MHLFLTSSPTGALDGSYRVDGLDNRNGFVDRLRRLWPMDARCLMISAFPADHEAGDEMTAFFREASLKMGLTSACFDLLDDRNPIPSAENLQSYDIIWLGGGHVPTQNAFFARLSLREKLRDYEGVVIGISAGSMNCAETVYAQPEEPGEAVDPDFRRFIPGLGLTRTNVLPHLQMVRHYVKDGLRLIDDISLGNSYGHAFLAICDGSYVYHNGRTERVFGESYRLKDGRFEPFCEDGGVRGTSELWLD